PELDIDEVPLSSKLKRKSEGGASTHVKKQRIAEEAPVHPFVQKWLQPPKHRVVVECSDRSALERGSALGFAFRASEVLRAPSSVEGKNLWGEVARIAAEMLHLAKNGAMAQEALRLGEVEANNALSVAQDDLETARRRQAELAKECEDANLEAAKAASLLQTRVDEEKEKLKVAHEAQLEILKRAHHEEVARLVNEKADLDKENGDQRSEIDLLLDEKKALQKENKQLIREGKRRQEEIEALKSEKPAPQAPGSDLAVKAQASLNSILILKRKLEADHPNIKWDVKEMANFVIDFMASGRPIVDATPAPPVDQEDEAASGSSSESSDDEDGDEEN
ncbi:unnamed protein product, partial [Linum tenue]